LSETETDKTITELELKLAWNLLYSEFCNISGNKSYSYTFELMRAITLLQVKLQAAKQLLTLPIDEVKEALKKFGYAGDIKTIESKIKLDMIMLQEKQKEYEKTKNKESKNEPKDNNFTSWIIAVSKFMGYRIDRQTTILLDFLEMSKQMDVYQKTMLKNGKRK
jgi:hypothetical protein